MSLWFLSFRFSVCRMALQETETLASPSSIPSSLLNTQSLATLPLRHRGDSGLLRFYHNRTALPARLETRLFAPLGPINASVFKRTPTGMPTRFAAAQHSGALTMNPPDSQLRRRPAPQGERLPAPATTSGPAAITSLTQGLIPNIKQHTTLPPESLVSDRRCTPKQGYGDMAATLSCRVLTLQSYRSTSAREFPKRPCAFLQHQDHVHIRPPQDEPQSLRPKCEAPHKSTAF